MGRMAAGPARGDLLGPYVALGAVAGLSVLGFGVLVTTVLHGVWWAGLVLACLVFCAISVGARFHRARRTPASDAG